MDVEYVLFWPAVTAGLVAWMWFQKKVLGWTWRQLAVVYVVLAGVMLVAAHLFEDNSYQGAILLSVLACGGAVVAGGYLAIRDHKLASAKDQS